MNRRCRPWWAACLVLILVLPAARAAAPESVLDIEGLSPVQVEASRELLDEVLPRLPPRWRDALGDDLILSWREDLPAHVAGHARGRRVLLDRHLLDDWIAVRSSGAAGGDAAARAVQAALIHELAHVFDRSPQGRLSRDPRLLDLAGWQKQPLRSWRGRNAFRDRSPDRYELQNPREFVAVNLEHFLLDPEYACRRPALADWFSQRVGPAPGPRHDCGASMRFMQGEGRDGAVSLLDLDPARVYAVDYLLAEGGDEAMSLWGHSMLRLVVCAPQRAPGPDCRLDLQYHRVLSFRAFVGDVQVSNWRGLTGSYPSRLFVLPLEQVIDEYNQVELRDLVSIPLKLDADDITALLERAARVHWSYDGRYWFVGNNCAVETWKLLHDGVPHLAQAGLSSITPRGLLRRLARAGVADRSVLDDADAALRRGYRFESAGRHYQAMLEAARESLPLPVDRVEDWLALSPAQRRPWLARANLRASAALFLLEQAAQRRQELRMRDELKHRLLAGDVDAQAARATVKRLLDDVGMLARPAALLENGAGYGLPQAAELPELRARVASRNARLVEGWPALWRQAREHLPERERADWDGTAENLEAIRERMRRLASEAQAS